jgi:hypothetical protein
VRRKLTALRLFMTALRTEVAALLHPVSELARDEAALLHVVAPRVHRGETLLRAGFRTRAEGVALSTRECTEGVATVSGSTVSTPSPR